MGVAMLRAAGLAQLTCDTPDPERGVVVNFSSCLVQRRTAQEELSWIPSAAAGPMETVEAQSSSARPGSTAM